MTGHSNRVWILGAPDPETAAIEQLLRECGERVEYATESSGERVSPRTAYTDETAARNGALVERYTDGDFDATHGPDSPVQVYVVECAAPVGQDGGLAVQYGHQRIDHHRPGDRGFGHGPNDFLAASSLGQVITELGRLGLLGFDQAEAPTEHPDFLWCWRPTSRTDDPDYAPLTELFGRWTVRSASGLLLEVPHALVVAAACDHCLGHAWAGRCPGVTRDDVRGYRARTAATRPTDPVDPDEYHRRFGAAITEVTHAPTLQIDDCACGNGLAWHDRGSGECYDCSTPFVRVADLRGRHVAELPDAACYLGVPYIASVTDRDGRTKVVVGGATTERCVNAFMRVWAPAQKLTGIYGDPARGFAGGYEVAP